MSDPPGRAIHATVVAIGEAGVLLRGESGSGKSRLAQALLAEGDARGMFSRLVTDDRAILHASGGRVVARAPPAIAGLIEERGSGLLRVAHEAAAVLRCVVDLAAADAGRVRPPRYPPPGDGIVRLAGAGLPRLRIDRDVAPVDAARRVLALLARS